MLLTFTSVIGLAQPSGFVDELISDDFFLPVGVTFDHTGQAYVWEKSGIVYLVDKVSGEKKSLIDLREEVMDFLDHGLNGFVLHPDFKNNGLCYLLYVVDKNYLLYKDSIDYDLNKNDQLAATIGRITRYKLDSGKVDSLSRKVILGDSLQNGIPILMDNHGLGSLVFGADTSLLVSVGDVAVIKTPPFQAGDPFYYELTVVPVEEGIITEDQNIGAYRAQSLNSLNGKILRINPEDGAGYNSNPFYESESPFSASSRIWARGMRNPFRFSLKPNTGSKDFKEGNPGTFYVGDVGLAKREEVNRIEQGGGNYGWPYREGISTTNEDFNNPQYFPQDHIPPIIEWRGDTPQIFIDGEAFGVGSPEFIGNTFSGNSVIGGIWLTTDHFSGYKDTYLVGDYSGWIKIFKFDFRNIPFEVVDIKDNIHPVCFAEDPSDGSVYYISTIFPDIHQFRRLYNEENPNVPPLVEAVLTPNYGSVPLKVTFDGTKSFDPDGTTLSFRWDFGNGQFADSPLAEFTYFQEEETVVRTSLEATDGRGKKTKRKYNIYLNNYPPEITSWTIEDINAFENEQGIQLDLDATFTNHDPNEQLFFDWSIILHHDDHSHLISTLKGREQNFTLTPIPCDGQVYEYEIKLFVYDDTGLGSTISKRIKPLCPDDILGPVLGISINPNPVDHIVDLQGLENYSNQEVLAQVFDILGKRIYQGRKNGAELKRDIDTAMANFPTGSYILKVYVNEKVQSLRFLKY